MTDGANGLAVRAELVSAHRNLAPGQGEGPYRARDSAKGQQAWPRFCSDTREAVPKKATARLTSHYSYRPSALQCGGVLPGVLIKVTGSNPQLTHGGPPAKWRGALHASCGQRGSAPSRHSCTGPNRPYGTYSAFWPCATQATSAISSASPMPAVPEIGSHAT